MCDWGTRPSDPGRGRLLADEGGPGDLRGDRLAALVRNTVNRSILVLGCMLTRSDIRSLAGVDAARGI